MKKVTTYMRLVNALFVLILLFAFLPSEANNIAVSSVSLGGRTIVSENNANNSVKIQFDLSWENSWRLDSIQEPYNWDAAWVFVKYRQAYDYVASEVNSSGTTVTVSSTRGLTAGMPVRITGGTGTLAANSFVSAVLNGTQFTLSATPTVALSGANIEAKRIWQHVQLADTGHSVPSNATLQLGLLTPGSAYNAASNPAVGAFIYRSANGTGTFSLSDAEFLWKYRNQGVEDYDQVEIEVYAIEMVYVNAGSFILGGGSLVDCFLLDTITSSTVNAAAGGLPASKVGSSGSATVNSSGIHSNWPNGFNAFYGMKHEISQKQYVDFLNALSYLQQISRTAFSTSGSMSFPALAPGNDYRNGIDILIPAIDSNLTAANFACNLDGDLKLNESNDGAFVACNYLSPEDIGAYLDWSALRPMTELEFIKACRGTTMDTLGLNAGYAWGNDSIYALSTYVDSGYHSETKDSIYRNVVGYNGVTMLSGPGRVGMLALSGTNRTQSGAGYYGMLDLTGGVKERVVGLDVSAGRNFNGSHGNGNISGLGLNNVGTWVSGTSSGWGLMGGCFENNSSLLSISNRQEITTTVFNDRLYSSGGRGVRTAP